MDGEQVERRADAPQEGAPDGAPHDGAPRRRWTPPGRPGGHRPALDGLRALAVAAVLLYHDDPAAVPGGFLGVSVFFTLSGFLVAMVLLARAPGESSLAAFWARRLRRLAPASLVALAGIVVFGATVATPEQVEVIPRDVTGAAAYVVNWVFIAAGTSYGQLFSDPSPVQHFWSLAIEEQLYVVLPLVVLVVRRRTSSPAVLGVVLGAAAVASTTWMAVLHARGASLDRLYYGTDTRLSEVFVGAALGVVLLRRDRLPSGRAARLVGALGGAALVAVAVGVATARLTDDVLYRGGFLLVSLATGTVILAVLVERGPLRLLGRGPLPAIGRVSYGVYLYHFPLFLWLTPERTGLDGWSLLALRLAVTGAAAAASYHLIEMPIRRGAGLGVPAGLRPALVPALAVLVALAGITMAGRHDPDATTALATTSGTLPEPGSPTAGGADGTVDVLVVAADPDHPVVTGLAALDRRDEALRVAAVEDLDCPRVVTEDGRARCDGWDARWADVVARHDPDVVLLVDGWTPQELAALAPDTDPTDLAEQLLEGAVDRWGAGGAPTISARTGVDLAAAVQRSSSPMVLAVNRLQSRRDDLRPPLDVDPSPAALDATVAGVADALRQGARRPEGAQRMMVVGDSQAQALGYGLERWGAANGEVTVWNAAAQGCGVLVGGQVEDAVSGRVAPDQQACVDTVAGWADGVARFDPDVVVVLSSVRDLYRRQVPGASALGELGQPAFDATLLDQYADAVDVLGSEGATVVWMVPPCVRPVLVDSEVLDDDRLARLADTVLARLAWIRRDAVELHPLDEVLCPGGTYRTEADGIVLRPDGIHLSPEGSDWVAAQVGPELVAG